MAEKLNGKVAIVTGAGRGLGRAFSLGLSQEGASVVAADISVDGAKETTTMIEDQSGKAIALQTDVTSEDDTQAMAKTAMDAYGRIDILVNNAGIYPVCPWDQISLDDWNRVLAVNLNGPFLCSRAVFPAMKEQKYGKIVNISSGTFFIGAEGLLHYVTTKGGVIGFTRTLAREVGDFGIRVNAITPGLTQTEGVKEMAAAGITEEVADQLAMQQAIKRKEQPQDLVGAVVFLSSPESDFITGQTLNVDGGSAMH